MNDIDIQIEEKLKELPEIALLCSSASNYAKVYSFVIDFLINRENVSCIYISLNRPFETIKPKIKKIVNPGVLFFIDGMITTASNQHEANRLSLPNMSLTDLAIAIEQATEIIKGDKKYLVIDSLSTLLLYIHKDSVSRFIHYLTGKLRGNKINGLFLAVERDSDKDFFAQISLFCDDILYIK